MKIIIAATPLHAKYVMSKPLKWLKVNRTALIFKEYLFHKKYRDGHARKKCLKFDFKKYSSKITLYCTANQAKELCIQKEDTPMVITGFNKSIRNLFYQEFFNFMDKWMIYRSILKNQTSQIKELAEEFMTLYNLSDDLIDVQTLLRNYRRYRENPMLDLHEILALISDDESIIIDTV